MGPNPSTGEDYCLWESTEREFFVGVLGTGPGFYSILDIIGGEEYQEFLPLLTLTALAEPGKDEGKLRHAQRLGVPIHSTCEEMLESHPEINLVVELVGSRFKMGRIRKELLEGVSFIDHNAAVFLCGLRDMAHVRSRCQLDLTRQQTLFRAVIDQMRDDIILLDRQRRLVDVNQSLLHRVGKDKDKLLGMGCRKLEESGGIRFCPQGPGEECPFEKTLETGRYAESMMTRVDKDGHLRYYRVYSYPIVGMSGALEHVLVIRRDITDRTKRERHSQQLEKMAAIGEMSTYLAHEIRNPLFSIGGFTNALLRSPNLTDKEREHLGIVAEEAKRLDGMLKSLLNFAKPTTDRRGEAPLNTVSRDAVQLMALAYEGKNYEITFLGGEEVPMVQADSEQLKQCIVDLVNNGLEAMPEGGKVEVSTGMENGFAFVRVRDDGPGMAERDMKKIFSPFYTTKTQGVGLGLAMIKKIVEDAGGSIDLSSREGEGTEVTLFLPPAVADTQPPGKGVNSGGSPEASKGSGRDSGR